MSDLQKEINRVKKALEVTTSPKLKSDYGKYLKKLYRKQKRSEMNGEWK